MPVYLKRGSERIGKTFTVLLVIVFYLQINYETAFAEKSLKISYTFFPVSNITLEKISSGRAGEGYLLYYRSDRGVQKPGIVVHLVRKENSSTALAEIYAAITDKNYVPITIDGNQVRLESDLPPSIIVHAQGGWWIRNRRPNYNLDIQINGPIQATWGGDLFTSLIKVGEPAVSIKVRDTDADGIPDWDLRNVIPPFPGRGYIRSNYAQRKCDTPTTLDYGLSPLWPYITSIGSYEQTNGYFRGPIVVDWESGKINYFSELVTVRNQNCGYSFYSLEPVTSSQTNQPNFETPFVLYDLSGQGEGYPNLVMRAERYPVGDPWMPGLDRDYEIIRYSWRNAIGDLRWDYKLEMLGFYPYSSITEIAGGLASIDAPSYESFPLWVVEKSWPVVTFVDAEGTMERSSEGIYEWSPREMGDGYFLGQASTPTPGAFSDIREGYRGEYRSDRSIPPELYVSPIDWRMHLRGAQAGLFNLGKGVYLREVNLDGGIFINGWVRLRNPTWTDLEQLQGIPSSKIEEALYALDGYLLYLGPWGIELRKSSYEPEFLRIRPPSDHETWQAFRQQVDLYTSRRKDPEDLYHWLDEYPGQRIWISRANIEQVRKIPAGFRFILELEPGFEVHGSQDLGFSNLTPGKYLVEYSGRFKISRLTPPTIKIEIFPGLNPIAIHRPNLIQLNLTNLGLEDLDFSTLVLQVSNGIEVDEIDCLPVSVISGGTVALGVDWQPQKSGPWVLDARLKSPDGGELSRTQLFLIVEEVQNSVDETFFRASMGQIGYGVFVLLSCFVLLVVITFHVARRLG